MTRPEIAPPSDIMEQISPKEQPKPEYKQPIADMVKPPAPAHTEASKDGPKEAPKQADEPDKLIEDHKPSKAQAKAQAKAQKAAEPKPVKQANHSNGVGAAIAATVVVVLGLAGLAVYAYLQSK